MEGMWTREGQMAHDHEASERILQLARWHLPAGDGAWPVGSEYVSLFWLPMLGPTSLLLLQRLDRLVGDTPAVVAVLADELAAALGLGSASTRSQLLDRAINRLIDFRALRSPAPGLIEVPAHLPSLSRGQLRRLPPSLAGMATPSLARQRADAHTRGRHHQLRRTLAGLGLEESEVEATLARLGYPETTTGWPRPRAIEGT
jgi:hypothetical protein